MGIKKEIPMQTVECYPDEPGVFFMPLHISCLTRSQSFKIDFSKAIIHFHVPYFEVSVLRTLI